MSADNPLIRVDPDDPTRCITSITGTSDGRCPFKAVEGTQRCPRHCGIADAKKNATQAANMYRLQIWQRRVDEFSESEQAKSLRSEVGIVRMLLEEQVKFCKTSTDLMLNSGKIADLATKLERLVISCEKLERNSGNMLDKASALSMAAKIVEVLASEIDDPELIDRVSDKLIDIIKETTGQTK